MQSSIRIYALGGQRLFTESIAARFDICSGIEFMGSTTDPDEALSSIREIMVDVLLIDANMDQVDVAKLTRDIKSVNPSLNVIIFGLDSDDEVILEVIESGANGYVSKESSFQDLVRIIEEVHEDRVSCSPRIAALVFDKIAKLSRERGFRSNAQSILLTPREQETLECISEGLSNKQIAQQLHISLFTVKNHVHNLFEKLKVGYRREAIRYAYNNGLIEKRWPAREPANHLITPHSGRSSEGAEP
jgi:two-component system, NarL family, nitrate/nitrite response regulator NarL